VSPLWRDEIAIRFAPGELVLTRTRRGLRPIWVGDLRRNVEAFTLTDWHGALAVLDGCLRERAWQRANVRVVLSNHWTRYAIVPWANDITTEEERLAHARICLANVYGVAADQWHVGLSQARPGATRVACAIPGELYEALRSTVEANGSRLVSVQPQLTVSYNGWKSHLGDTAGWFVNIDEGSLAAARLAADGWDRVYCARIGTDWSLELQRLRTFGRLANSDSDDCRVFVAAPEWLRKLAGGGEEGIVWLHDESADVSGQLAVLRRLYV
jgi:hypothetical protein